MVRKPETALTKRVLDKLRKVGGFWVKIHGGPWQTSGLPDIVGCYLGRFYGFEVKVGDNQPTKRQALVLSLIEQAGGVSRVVRDPQDALDALVSKPVDSDKLFPGRDWLAASQTCVVIGLSIGEKPISQWKLRRLVEAGSIRSRYYGQRRYYSMKSIQKFLEGE